MKEPIRLPADDGAGRDRCAQPRSTPAGSAAQHHAVGCLPVTELGAAYEDAFADWEESGESLDWDQTAADGVQDGAPG